MTKNAPLWGVFWMLATGLCFVTMNAAVKHLGGAVPAAQAAFIRFVFGTVMLLPLMGAFWRMRLPRRDWVLFGARGVVHTFAVILWFYAMARIPLAEVTAMNYLNPIFMTIGAAALLGERLSWPRIIAICVAVLGMLIVLRPGLRVVGMGHLAMLGTSLFLASGYLIAKRLSDHVPPAVIVGVLSIIVTIGLVPFAAAVWVTPTLDQLAWLAVTALFATVGHYTMTLAFRVAPITVTQPVTFLQLVWASALGAIAFGESLDPWVILGGGLIVGSVVYITWRERRRD
jgi:drug/metabolite transporter (DMT)-like permease